MKTQSILPIGVEYDRIAYGDTLGYTSDSLYTTLKYLRNDTVVAEAQAFLVPDTIELAKFPRLSRRLFLKKYPVTNIVRHGTTTERAENLTRISSYSYGSLEKVTVLDKNNNERSFRDFPARRGPCGNMTGECLIGVQKKK